METLRRPAVYRGVTYPEYEVDFYTSNIYSLKQGNDKILKPRKTGTELKYLSVSFKLERDGVILYAVYPRQHKLLAETFQDKLSKSPLVSYYNLQIGRDRHELKTPTGFTFICNLVCPDHIDGNGSNNHHTNIMLVTHHENILKCGPIKGKKYKGVYKTHYNTWQVEIKWLHILDKNGKKFTFFKNFKTEEEAALAYNTILEEAMLTIWGPDLGPKMYDLAYKNEVPALCQTSFEGF